MKKSMKFLVGLLCRRARREWKLDRLRQLVYKDELTQIGNLRAFREETAHRIKSGKPFGILYLDLDRFKKVNDTYGHRAGDKVLREVAGALKNAALPGVHVFRLGGDEFAMIVPEASETGMALLKLRREFDIAKRVRIGSFAVGASMGSARFPEDGRTTTELLDAADRRMYAEKARRKAELPYTLAGDIC
ncbi:MULTISPECIES: GGDEF domain-containing protein [Bhargavaea]|uniref:GGDEF domain-containing protein n=1 Tax=Bhargavaea changchunensis TaxID=2134037 RepID=A0ABW2NKC9_9BACL|nr:GGDEF domain-containing protein [Bhargavaea sp. CC-171006]